MYISRTIAQTYSGKVTGVESNCYSILFENNSTADVTLYPGQGKRYRTLAPGESVIYGGENPEILQKTVFNLDTSVGSDTIYVEREYLTKETPKKC